MSRVDESRGVGNNPPTTAAVYYTMWMELLTTQDPQSTQASELIRLLSHYIKAVVCKSSHIGADCRLSKRLYPWPCSGHLRVHGGRNLSNRIHHGSSPLDESQRAKVAFESSRLPGFTNARVLSPPWVPLSIMQSLNSTAYRLFSTALAKPHARPAHKCSRELPSAHSRLHVPPTDPLS